MSIGRLLGKGNTADIYEWGSDKILKLYNEKLPPFLCTQEFEITKQVYALLGVCPEAFELVEQNGRCGAIYQRVSGKTLMQRMMFSVWTLKKKSRLLAQLHRDIHQEVPFELPSVKEQLISAISRVPAFTDAEKAYLYEYIRRLPDGNTLCHMDFHPLNILMQGKKPVVIDWMTAVKGCALADVARSYVILKYSVPPVKNRLLQKLIAAFANTLCEEYLREYLRLANASRQDVERWIMPIAAARMNEWLSPKEKSALLKVAREKMADKKG